MGEDQLPTRRLSTKVFRPQQAPNSTNKPNVFRPNVFQANPPSTSQSLPNCLSKAPYLLSFTISYFHDFGTSLPYKSFISSRRLQRSEESLINISRIFMETTPHCPTQCLSTKRQCEIKFEENTVPQRNEHLRLEKRKSPKSFRRGESEVAT